MDKQGSPRSDTTFDTKCVFPVLILLFSNATWMSNHAFQSWHYLLEVAQTPQVKDSVPQDCLNFRCHLQVPGTTCTSDWSYPGKFSQLPARFNRLLEWLAELRKTLYLPLLVYYNGYHTGIVKWRRCAGWDMGGTCRGPVPITFPARHLP